MRKFLPIILAVVSGMFLTSLFVYVAYERRERMRPRSRSKRADPATPTAPRPAVAARSKELPVKVVTVPTRESAVAIPADVANLRNARTVSDWQEKIPEVCAIEAALLEGNAELATQVCALYQETAHPLQKGLLAVLMSASSAGLERLLQDRPSHTLQDEGAMKPLLLYAICRNLPKGGGAARDEENRDRWQRRLTGIAYLVDHNTPENERQLFDTPSGPTSSSETRRAPGLNDFRAQFPDEVRKALLQSLNDPHPEVAGIAFRAIRLSHDRPLTSDFVSTILTSPDERLADLLAAVDASLLNPEAVDRVGKFVQSASTDSRAVEQAVEILARRPGPETEKALLDAYPRDSREQVKIRILGALEKSASAEARTLGLAELRNPSPAIRTAAVQTIAGNARSAETLSALRQSALADESPAVRQAALGALTSDAIGAEEATLLRRVSTEDPSPEVRAWAAKTLERSTPLPPAKRR